MSSKCLKEDCQNEKEIFGYCNSCFDKDPKSIEHLSIGMYKLPNGNIGIYPCKFCGNFDVSIPHDHNTTPKCCTVDKCDPICPNCRKEVSLCNNHFVNTETGEIIGVL